jgi:hypothetical protein
MPASIRPNKKSKDIAYKILKTPRDLQQISETTPDKERSKRWYSDSFYSQ